MCYYVERIIANNPERFTKRINSEPFCIIISFLPDGVKDKSCKDWENVHHKYYFPGPKGKHYDSDNFSRKSRIANRKASPSQVYLDYRHTFGSHLTIKRQSLHKTSVLMGNSAEICSRHYAALMPETLADSIEFRNMGAKL